jgi:hypothetical protein
MRNISDKAFTENQTTHFVLNFPFSENRAFFSDYVQKYGTARQATGNNTVRRMRFVRSITKATDTHAEYVNIYCFSMAKRVTRTHLIVTLHLHGSCCVV